MKRKPLRRLAWTGAIFFLLLFSLCLIYYLMTRIEPPTLSDHSAEVLVVNKAGPTFFYCKDNWLKKSESGLWEMFIQGEPYERGVINGKLSANLIYRQEKAFIDRISEMVPSRFYQHFLKYFIYWFNRNLDKYVTEEYKLEIYGISRSASDDFSFIGNKYRRLLNYHSAHDIGHALKDLQLVGCTSFGVWNDLSTDSSLIIGRNFDFYAGDEFAKNKIVCFEKPEKGYAFMMVTWGGMIGTVSGMNIKGLTVTINAAKSEIPFSARTPISILAREILQYAKTIPEAFKIARQRQTFVSESILIGSGDENKAAIIEKAPFGISLFVPSDNYVICTNHFQSSLFRNDLLNKKTRREDASVYRFNRVFQLLRQKQPLDPVRTAGILRNPYGLSDKDIGFGNEKAVNQFIAHHSIIFKPGKRLVWISTSPYQLGPYVCYDLCKIFNTFAGLQEKTEMTEPDMIIPADPFLKTDSYKQFLRYRGMRKVIIKVISMTNPVLLNHTFFKEYEASNPGYYEVYSLSGDYWMKVGDMSAAIRSYKLALDRTIPRLPERNEIIAKLAGCLAQRKNEKK